MVTELLLITLATLASVGYAIPATVSPYDDDAPFSIQPRDPGFTVQPRSVVVEPDCKGQGKVTLLSYEGWVIFRTPNFPNVYPKNSNCSWEIKGQTPDTRISIGCMENFELEPKNSYSECRFDYLDIDGSRYCGAELNDTLYTVSTTNTVKITFVSDGLLQFKGFNCLAIAYEIPATATGSPTTSTGSSTASCGRVNRAMKIVGGVETEVHEYPWQIGFTYGLHDTSAFCGGSIINELWILTAAHCRVEAGDYAVAGEHAWDTETETSATHRIVIEQVFAHPEYNYVVHDVALVKLASSLTFDPTNKVAPVCPPSPNDPYDNVDAIVTGWGALSEGGGGPTGLQEVVVPTMTNSECSSFYGGITDDMICAGFPEGGKDSCQGDSGGPMVTADGDIFRQIGVVSWGDGCARPELPGVYSRVNYELEWITNTISGSSWSEPETEVTTESPTTPTESHTASCGQVNRQQKIVGGVETEVHEYPWQIGFVGNNQSTWSFCGGSIINEWWILTAAHCGMAQGHYAVAGEHSWATDAETSATERKMIEKVVRHPGYYGHENDFALVKLASPLTFDPANKVAPVCPPEQNSPYDNVEAIVTGWGTLTQGGSRPDTLQEVEVPTMTNDNCKSFYGSSITDDMMCAGLDKGGKDSCQGDSGGPMITADEDIYRQIGVVSWGKGCANAAYPGVYGRVNYVLEWITTTISGTSWAEPEPDYY